MDRRIWWISGMVLSAVALTLVLGGLWPGQDLRVTSGHRQVVPERAPDSAQGAVPPADPRPPAPSASRLPVLPPAPHLESGNQALARFVTKDHQGSGDPHAAVETDAARLTADFMALVPRVETPSEVAAVRYVMEDWTDEHAIRNEAINLLRRSRVDQLDRALIALLDRDFEEDRMRTFFIQHLGSGLLDSGPGVPRQLIQQRLVTALQDRHRAVRREALSALVEVKDPVGMALLARDLESPELEGMRDLAIYLYHRLDAREHLPAVRAHASDADQVVRIAAVYVLGQWRDRSSRPALTAAATSPVFAVKRAGEIALQQLEKVETNGGF